MGARLKLAGVHRDVRIYHGAATHHRPRTTSLVVFHGLYGDRKRFKYVVSDPRGFANAYTAASAFIDTLETSPEGV